jgi:t-SNARE complex subunit (syntaxin)
MEVDRIKEWQSWVALRPPQTYQPVLVQEYPNPTIEIKKKRRSSMFHLRRHSSTKEPPPTAQQDPMEEYKREESTLEMDDFFSRHHRVRKNLRTLHLLHDQLHQNNRAQLGATDEPTLARCDQINEALTEEMTRITALIRQDLTELLEENKRLEQVASAGSGYLRMRQITHASLKRQFAHAKSLIETEQRCGQNQVRDTIKRQLKIVDPNLSESEADQLADPEKAHMLRSNLFSISGKESAQRLLEQVDKRRESMMKVEKNIAALARLYNDMEMTVEEQQANLDSVETFVNGAVEHVEKAAVEMSVAVEHQQNIRKARCLLL